MKPPRTRWVAVAVTLAIVSGAGVVAFVVRAREQGPRSVSPGVVREPHFGTQVERGAYLFNNMGCVACHGAAGHGGVVNPNYARDTVPALDVIAEQLALESPEDAHAVVDMINHGQDPVHAQAPSNFEGWDLFVPRFRDLIVFVQNGSTAAKRDPNGPVPPLQMPSWRARLRPDAIRAIMAYMITRYDWNG